MFLFSRFSVEEKENGIPFQSSKPLLNSFFSFLFRYLSQTGPTSLLLAWLPEDTGAIALRQVSFSISKFFMRCSRQIISRQARESTRENARSKSRREGSLCACLYMRSSRFDSR